MGDSKKFESLSTSYVSLAALLRQLREQNFAGSISVVLEQYEAEIVLNGLGPPLVTEIDPVTRRATQTDGAMERLLVHSRQPGGSITVYEEQTRLHVAEDHVAEVAAFAAPFLAPVIPATEEVDWGDLLDAGGKLIRAVERAVENLGANFPAKFRAACIELGDDYPFLDPTGNGLSYANGVISLGTQPAVNVLVTGLSECLRRVVDKLARGKEAKRFRENVAIELAVAARMRPTGMSDFTGQLDRVAGTRVL